MAIHSLTNGTRSIPWGFSSKFSCLSHAPLLFLCLLPWWILDRSLHTVSQEHTWNGWTSVTPYKWKKKLKLDSIKSGHLGRLVGYCLQNRCGGNITYNHTNCWFEKAGTDYSSQDEVWRPGHQDGLHVLDVKGREEISSGLEADTWAVGEDFKHIPVLSLQALSHVYFSLCSLINSTTWILFEEESYKIRILSMHQLNLLLSVFFKKKKNLLGISVVT